MSHAQEIKMAWKPNLPDELTDLLNKYSRENLSNTPDYVLSRYLMGCLVNFEEAVKGRDLYKNPNSWDGVGESTISKEEMHKLRAEANLGDTNARH